jgi:hypothetical protein
MQEVIQKIQELYSLLEKKMADADSRYEDARNLLDRVEAAQKKLEATQNNNAALERKLNKYADFEVERANLSEAARKVSEDRAMINANIVAIADAEVALEKKKKDLDNLISIYKKKSDDLVEEKKALDEQKKKMRETILDELRKKM